MDWFETLLEMSSPVKVLNAIERNLPCNVAHSYKFEESCKEKSILRLIVIHKRHPSFDLEKAVQGGTFIHP
jgi:hypothetical protein